jgi:glycogen debranching enzyme
MKALFLSLMALFANLFPADAHEYSVPVPNIWGPRQLFCFSALDGPTNFFEPYTCFTLEDRFGIQLANKGYYMKRPLWFGIEVNGQTFDKLPGGNTETFDSVRFDAVTSSYIKGKIEAKGIAAEIELVFVDRSTIGGRITIMPSKSENSAAVDLLCHDPGHYELADNSLILADSVVSTIIHFNDKAEMDSGIVRLPVYPDKKGVFEFTISLHYSGQKYTAPEYHFNELVDQRVRSIVNTPLINKDIDEQVYKTYLKAVSVLRGNTESAVGQIKFMWTTPDRAPHRFMWLWDSGFHGLGLRYFNPEAAQAALQAILCVQQEDGFIPHVVYPDGSSKITQPPILGWCTWEVYETTGDQDFLRYCYPHLRKFVEWFFKNRDENKNGLYEWVNYDESMDNSPRFDNCLKMDAVDLNCFLVNDLRYLSRIAKELKRPQEEIDSFVDKATSISEKTNELLWCREDSFYYDKTLDGKFIKSKAVSGLLPLFAKVAAAEEAAQLLPQVLDETEWFTAIPFPSLSLKDKDYDLNMWRGGTWINYSYFIYRGLINYGKLQESRETARRVINAITKGYCSGGTIYEYYDPNGQVHPDRLPRKKTVGCIHEFGWSSALFICFVNEINHENNDK